VFVNRLRQGMLLQTDPTVIYGMGDKLRRQPAQARPAGRHALQHLHPPGLPPTPIAMPGLASLQAALHPPPTEALYFVARGDGSSQFSPTLDEHNQAVKALSERRKTVSASQSERRQRGKFITFEGIDGAGKSSHIAGAAALVRGRGLNVLTTREPGGTPLGEKLRELLLHEAMHLETEALLMFAARREHLERVIEPALARGDWVICDRFSDATYAYQSGGRGLDKAKFAQLERWVHGHLQPDSDAAFRLAVVDRQPAHCRSRARAGPLRAGARRVS
jgi:dTMP kinase